MNDNLIIKILNAAKALNDLMLKEKQSLPYNINLIDELHINENAHSRILNMLLQYSHNGQYVILKSFVEMIKKINPTINISVKSPECTCEQDRIDVLIKENGKYAIIIENKVNYAVDQYEQIKRYIEIVKNKGINEKDIYVIYLTRESDKEVSDYSLPDETKRLLDYGKDNSRFILLNFRDHILPWLEDDVLPNCALKEDLLISALKQYIDFLKGLLTLRIEQIKIQEKMDNFTKKELGIDSLEKAIAINKDVKLLSESVDSIIEEMINKIAEDKILDPLKNEIKCEVEGEFGNTTFQVKIKLPNWKKCCIRFSLEGVGFIYGISHYDVTNHITEKDQKIITNRFPRISRSSGFSVSEWWPCYKRLPNLYVPNGNDYWEEVESGKIDICKKMIECINEIYSNTKDIEL